MLAEKADFQLGMDGTALLCVRNLMVYVLGT